MSLRADIRLRRGAFTLEARFDANPGEPLALIGPNGSGKSTIAAALAGIVRLDAGSIELDGVALSNGRKSLPPQARRVGVVFQDRLLFPTMSVRDNVAFGLRAQGMKKREARNRSGAWLERFALTDLADRKPAQLSGGEAQRVALARALAIEPALLILDEPLAALDQASKPEVRRLIAETLRGFGGVSLCITHDPIEARALADRIAVLESGRIVQMGSADEIQRAPRSAYAASFVGINLYQGVARTRESKRLVEEAVRVGGGDGSEPATIRTAHADLPEGAPVFAALHPRAVVLSAERPASSARNACRCVVASVDPIEGALRVTLTGAIALTAEITSEAAQDLSLSAGSEVWASFKATEVAVYRR